MAVFNFEYDGMRLSDFGYIVCEFDSKDVETVSNGSNITFNTTPLFNGEKYVVSSATYNECLTATFQICKNPCLTNGNVALMSMEDVRTMTRWLNRKQYCKFRLLSDGYEGVYFEGSFNISVIRYGQKIYGLELSLTTNRPFAIGDMVEYTIDITSAGQICALIDESDEIGHLYMDTHIICISDGDLTIHNHLEDRKTVLLDCTAGEEIDINYPVISSSIPDHEIYNCFNFNFPRIVNSGTSRINEIEFSLPCRVTFRYNPIVKVGI